MFNEADTQALATLTDYEERLERVTARVARLEEQLDQGSNAAGRPGSAIDLALLTEEIAKLAIDLDRLRESIAAKRH